jgi:GT2 family glycosyltransferase
VFVNPDAFLQRNCVKMLVQALKGRPNPSIAGACVLNADGAEQRGGRRGEVTAITTLLSFAHLTGAFRKLRGFEIHREHEALPRSVTPMPTISGACFAARRDDFLGLGGFDEGYFLHVEDIDLCWRARKMGGEVLFQPRAKVVHLGHTSLEHPVRVEFHKGVGLARYFMKRADKPHRLVLATVLAPLIMAVAVIRPALWKITGRPI